jgi:hypothetical protein
MYINQLACLYKAQAREGFTMAKDVLAAGYVPPELRRSLKVALAKEELSFSAWLRGQAQAWLAERVKQDGQDKPAAELVKAGK